MDEYLAHHGVLKQKWGVRRYQNEDGTLTAAGRARLGLSPTPKKSKGSEKANESEKKDVTSQTQRKNIDKLSNDELQSLIRRIELEQRYAKLTTTPEAQKKVSAGREVANRIIKDSTTTVGTQLATYLMREGVNTIAGKKILKEPKK